MSTEPGAAADPPRDLDNPAPRGVVNGHAAGAPSDRSRLRDWFGLDLVGNVIFVAACLSLLLAALCFALASIYVPNWADTFAIASGRRVFELILTVAGLGVFVSMVTRTQNSFVAALGIMVITALILPPREIMRFALLITGSERRMGDYYEAHSATGSAASDMRSVEASAFFIIERLRTASGSRTLTGTDRAPIDELLARAWVKEVIEDELVRLLAASAFNRLSAVGAIETLNQLAEDNRRADFILRNRNNERFGFHVALLRHENAISYTFDNLDSITLTPFGLQLARHDPEERRPIPRSGLREAILPDALRRRDPLPPCSDWPIESSAVPVPELANLPTQGNVLQPVDLQGTDSPILLRFEVGTSPDAIDHEFVFRAEPGSALDPTLMIAALPATAQTQAERRAGCRVIGWNDDAPAGIDLTWAGASGSRLNAYIRLRLTPGTYVLRLGAFGISGGPGTLVVRRTPGDLPAAQAAD